MTSLLHDKESCRQRHRQRVAEDVGRLIVELLAPADAVLLGAPPAQTTWMSDLGCDM